MTDTRMQLEDWLDDLCVRFIINLPEEDLSSVPRICFQVEEAQWFYEDFIRPLDPTLPSMSLRKFCLRIFAHCPLLSAFSQGDHMRAFEDFLLYKTRVPVRGAIMLNEAMDSAVLVKGWKKGANWSFPRGKINKDEDDLACAIREVYEETGYDIKEAGLVPDDEKVKFIEINMREQQMRLYVFRGVPMDTHFEPKTRKEISKIQWYRLSELPAFRKKGQPEPEAVMNANRFYMVAPFLVPLKKWVVEQKKKDAERATTNQYLSAGLIHDDVLTEEDPGTDSYAHTSKYTGGSGPEFNTMEGTTALLRSMLKIQPPTQGLQAEAMSAVQSPVAKNSGEALLALLHGKPGVSQQPAPPNAPSHIPLSLTYAQPPIPRSTPHHQLPRLAQFSTLPPPLTFPLQPRSLSSPSITDQPVTTYPNHESNPYNVQQQDGKTGFQQNSMPAQHQNPILQRNPHPYQPQHLVHPQPLPPHVQRGLFTGGLAHAPMVPQPIQQDPASNLAPAVSVALPNTQFSNIHSPMVAPRPQLTPPKLTSHSLALLNAFKSRDQPNPNDAVLTDPPLRRYLREPEQISRTQLQELPAETSQPPQNGLASQFGVQQSLTQALNLTTASSRPLISETHKAVLLDMFKNPSTAAAAPPVTATALPRSATPSAVELSAVEPLSSSAGLASTPPILDKNVTAKNHEVVPEPNPKANLPFQAVSILTRPQQANEHEGYVKKRSSQKPHSNMHKLVQNGGSSKAQPTPALTQTPQKPFQPQILKRPQPQTSAAAEFIATSTSPPAVLPMFPLLDRHITQSPDHKQMLLSLFGKAPSSANPLSMAQTQDGSASAPPIDTTVNASSRSRVGSLPSGGRESRRGSQVPISSADKGFLLNYLDNVAKGSLH